MFQVFITKVLIAQNSVQDYVKIWTVIHEYIFFRSNGKQDIMSFKSHKGNLG